ncbi:MAG: DUF1540 domain-containing protein [Chloroflexi bacterium]|nr:DUF1540 domain-containing protein [Chloroflexota bacterium]
MPRIRCLYLSCIHLEDNYCSASRIEIDPDEGCLTFSQLGDADENIWDDDLDGSEEWDDGASTNDNDFDEW